MAAAFTVTRQWWDGRKLWVCGTIALSGSYTQGGDTVTFASTGVQSSQIPFFYTDPSSSAGTAAQAQNSYNWVPGTTQANGKIRCFIGAAAELAAGAYPAAATGDVIVCLFGFEMR